MSGLQDPAKERLHSGTRGNPRGILTNVSLKGAIMLDRASRSRRMLAVAASLLTLILTPLEGQDGSTASLAGLHDHQSARERYLSELFTAPTEAALRFSGRKHESKEGGTELFVLRQGDEFLIHAASRVPPHPPTAGDYIVRRSVKSSYLLDIKIILADGGGRYLLLTPRGQSTAMDLVVDGAQRYSGISLGLPLYHFLARPLSVIQDLAGQRVDWAAVLSLPRQPSMQ